MKKAVFAIVILYIYSTFCSSQNNSSLPVAIRFSPTPGDDMQIIFREFNLDTKPSQDSPADYQNQEDFEMNGLRKQSSTEKEIAYYWKIKDRDVDGNTVMEVSFAYLKLEMTTERVIKGPPVMFSSKNVMSLGITITVDTRDSILNTNPIFQEAKSLPAEQIPPEFDKMIANLENVRSILNQTLIGKPMTVVVSPEAKVISVKGMDVIWDQYRDLVGKIKTDLAQRAQLDQLMEAFFGEDNITKMMNHNLLLPYPKNAVNIGDSWSDNYVFELGDAKLQG